MDVRAALTARLQDIPGVAQVVVDLDESSGGIHVRLEQGADEDAVLEKMRSLLVAYGLRPRETQLSEEELSGPPRVDEDSGTSSVSM